MVNVGGNLPPVLVLWGEQGLEELVAAMVGYLGPKRGMSLRCVSHGLNHLININLLQRACSHARSAAAAECVPHPIIERVRTAETFDDSLVVEVIAASMDKYGHDKNALAQPNSFGQTALMWAAGNGCAPLCGLLLNLGSDIDAVDSGGWTALFRACWHGQHAAAKVLIHAGADLNTTKAKYTPLMAAARFGHYAVVRELLTNGADASLTTSFGETALSLALHLRQGAVVDLLQGCSLGRPLVPCSSDPAGTIVGLTQGEAAARESLRRHHMNMQGRWQAQLAFHAAVAAAQVSN
jgi:hypothetical protein